MKARIQVLSIEKKSGVSKQGNKYEMTVCQCVVQGEKIQVGELVLPREHPEVTPGVYDAEFGVAIDRDKRIGGALIRLIPVAQNQVHKAA